VALCLALAACNAGGRPKNAPKVAEPVAAARPAVNAADFGKTVGGDYVVAPGDTLAVVAERTNTPIRSLIDMNGLQPPYGLAPGTRLALQQRSQYVVQPEDTLPDLAARYGVTQSELVSVNHLTPPYTLEAGQKLNIPSQNEASNLPAIAATAVPPPTPAGSVSSTPLPAPPGTTPTVNAPTVTAPIVTAPTATTNGVNSATLPAPTVTAPTVTAPTATVPKASQTQSATVPPPLPATPTAPVTSGTATTATKAKTPEEADAATEAALDAVEAAKEAGPAAGSGKGAFVWPVQGKIIGAFGSSKDGLKNDGVNIAAPSGAPVVASADGTVAYAGNELRGFGNMILLRHDGGYVTAYAHNASLLVKKGDKVKRGQTIARVGATGAVFGPQLHFEIRKGTQPVDPMTFLGG
jgi:murein DD-endopeptidase MepM/ murein hydrolase activator NlpD